MSVHLVWLIVSIADGANGMAAQSTATPECELTDDRATHDMTQTKEWPA
jgi:hypothetical protein